MPARSWSASGRKIAIAFKPYATIKEPFSGGMGNFVYLLSKYLAERGHQVTVLAGKDSILAPKVKLYSPKHSENSYNVYQAGDQFYQYVNSKLKTKQEVVNQSFSELSKRFDRKIEAYLEFFSYVSMNDFDVVHVVTHDIIATYSALFSNTPAVVSFHGHYDILGPDFISWLKFIKKSKSPKHCIFVSVSKYIQKEYDNFLKSKLIYNAIDVSRYTLQTKKQNYIAFLGRIDYYKGLEFAIKFSQKYKIPLKIGGRVEDKPYFNKLKKEIDGKLIKFLGPQNETQKNKLLGNAKALMMSSHYAEAFGRVTAEALACGTPVIAFNKGASPELITNGKTGFIIPENNLTAAKKAWDKIGKIKPQTCRDFVAKNFDIKTQILQYEMLYKKLKK